MTDFSDTKPATQSLTVWSAVAAILSGLSTIALVASGQVGPDAIGGAVLAIGGGIGAIVGRLRARARIG
jgi:hypothetical protein